MIILGIMSIPTAISAYLLLQVVLGNAAKTWPTTKGNLEQYNLKKWTVASKFSSLQGEAEQCVVSVKYSYEVGGTVYKSRRINFGLDKYYLTPQGYYRAPEDVENDELLNQLKSNVVLVRYWHLLPSIAALTPGVINEKRHYWTIAVAMSTGVLLSLAYTLALK